MRRIGRGPRLACLVAFVFSPASAAAALRGYSFWEWTGRNPSRIQSP